MMSARQGTSAQAALNKSARSGEERETPWRCAWNTATSHFAEKASKARLRSSHDAENALKRKDLRDALSDMADTTTNFDLRRGIIAASSSGGNTTQSAHSAVPLGMPSQRRNVGTRRTSKASLRGAGACSVREHVASYLRRAASNKTSLSGCDATSNSPGHVGAARSPGAAANLSFLDDCCANSGAIAAATERPIAPGDMPVAGGGSTAIREEVADRGESIAGTAFLLGVRGAVFAADKAGAEDVATLAASRAAAAFRAARRKADTEGVDNGRTPAARRTGAIVALLDIQRKEKTNDERKGKRKRQTLNHANHRACLLRERKAGSCGPVITVTAEWSVHGFAEPKKSGEWKLSPSGDATQRTTMKAYLLQ